MKSIKSSGVYALILSQLLATVTIAATDIIIDLGGVLIKTKKMKAAHNIGMFNLCAHQFTHWKNPRKDFYKFLNDVKADTKSSQKFAAYDEKHRQLPCVMCDWLKGVPSEKILKRIQKAQPSRFNWKLAQTVFSPTIMGQSKSIIKSGEKFVRDCIAQGHNVYILANQDAETFEIMKERFPELFNLFSGIVISGDCKLAKPDPAIFNNILTTYNLDPHQCIFIDDQRENIDAAKKMGLETILVSNKRDKHFKKARAILHALNQRSSNKE